MIVIFHSRPSDNLRNVDKCAVRPAVLPSERRGGTPTGSARFGHLVPEAALVCGPDVDRSDAARPGRSRSVLALAGS
ncbi:hypothetical protein GCM10009779_44020 [Polymorphospora rubra]|uniref:Uncharacterized protein n=1 Tax=Polymorphospora rubra TaxID=338584 RepID=A0A810N943_9ACTN|nr:hypothetical protein Prubr_51340 [Polymorphospora rubra]